MKKEFEKTKSKELPLGGDYALDINDNFVLVFEDRSGRREKKGK